jgi:hypothetical protein
MRVKMHKLIDRSRLEVYWREKHAFVLRMLDLVKSGKGDFQGCYTSVMRDSVELGCTALILGKPDEEAVAEFRKAAEYALTLLTEGGTSHSFTSYEVQVDPEETGGQIPKVVPHHFPAGGPLDPVDYRVALATVIAFGSEAERRIAAEYPEERYRDPEVVLDESLCVGLRALKALVKGDEETARKEGLAALKVCREPAARPEIMALVSLVTREEDDFREHLEERVKVYKKQYERSPSNPEGFVYLSE